MSFLIQCGLILPPDSGPGEFTLTTEDNDAILTEEGDEIETEEGA